MAGPNGTYEELYRPVKSLLISQPEPVRSPFYELSEKYGLEIAWRPFIKVEGLSEKEVRKQRIYIEEYSAVIFNARGAIDHFFRIVEEMRVNLSEDMRYFCISEAVANYLQKYINYRKRKVFVGEKGVEEFKPILRKAKNKDRFLLPCSNLGAKDLTGFLTQEGFNYTEAMMFRTVPDDLSDLTHVFYDVLVFFSPLGIESLLANFPGWQQKDTRLATFGKSTTAAAEAAGLYVNIPCPTPEAPSMPMAIERYLELSNKRSKVKR